MIILFSALSVDYWKRGVNYSTRIVDLVISCISVKINKCRIEVYTSLELYLSMRLFSWHFWSVFCFVFFFAIRSILSDMIIATWLFFFSWHLLDVLVGIQTELQLRRFPLNSSLSEVYFCLICNDLQMGSTVVMRSHCFHKSSKVSGSYVIALLDSRWWPHPHKDGSLHPWLPFFLFYRKERK